jgi:4-hydroxy-4-methyl-2-oxoglutarate aldolase
MKDDSSVITLEMMRQALYTAVVCDVLDSLGYTRQSPPVSLRPLSGDVMLIGRAKTTLWTETVEPDPSPYELELLAVDACQPDDVLIAAAGGSTRSGIWGELLSTAARNRGCRGAIVDGCVRDIAKMREMRFPVFARATSPYDSKDRQRVTAIDVPVEIAGVTIHPGEIVIADIDGVAVIPRSVETEVIRGAWNKVHAENEVRSAIQNGMKATEAYRRFGVL